MRSACLRPGPRARSTCGWRRPVGTPGPSPTGSPTRVACSYRPASSTGRPGPTTCASPSSLPATASSWWRPGWPMPAPPAAVLVAVVVARGSGAGGGVGGGGGAADGGGGASGGGAGGAGGGTGGGGAHSGPVEGGQDRAAVASSRRGGTAACRRWSPSSTVGAMYAVPAPPPPPPVVAGGDVRPAKRWFAVAALVAVGGVVLAIVIGVVGYGNFTDRIEGFQRVDVPGQGEVTLGTSGYTVYHEYPGATDDSDSSDDFGGDGATYSDC